MSLYQLAENLGMTVYEMSHKMPVSEFQGWIEFYSRRSQEAAAADRRKGAPNLLDMDPAALAKAFGANG
jgi:hypothetical protein